MQGLNAQDISHISRVLTEHDALIAEQSRQIAANEEALQQQRTEAKALAEHVTALRAEHERLTTDLAEVRTEVRGARVQLASDTRLAEEQLADLERRREEVRRSIHDSTRNLEATRT